MRNQPDQSKTATEFDQSAVSNTDELASDWSERLSVGDRCVVTVVPYILIEKRRGGSC